MALNDTIKIPVELFIGSTATFGTIILICVIVVVVYIRKFAHEAHPGAAPRFVSGLTCTLVLMTSLLLPVDVFMTSYQKYPNGTWREWAADNNTRVEINNAILYTYYTCYSLLTFCLFLLTPFAYFFFEEGDAEEDTPAAERLCSAFKYSFCFVFLVVALLLVGAFVQFGHIPNSNGTVIDDLNFLGDQIKSKGVESALSFTISVLTVLGLFVYIIYSAYGLSAFPFNFVKTRGNAARELEKLRVDQIAREEKERQLAAKYADGRPVIPSDRRLLQKISRDKERYNELQRLVESDHNSCWRNLQICCRPFSIVLGIFLTLISLAFMSSVTVTLVDKYVHSNYTLGYVLTTVHYKYSPINYLLTYSQLVFPLDYILVLLIVFYIACCTVNGIRRIGIWFFWIKMFEVIPRRTMPQGLLLLSALFSYAMIALNQLALVAMPTYSTYGSQHYMVMENGTDVVKPCDNRSPPGECQLTQLASIITRFTIHANLYGAVVTYLLSAFVGAYVIGFVVAAVRRKRSFLEKAVGDRDAEDDPLLNL
ncbi:hypothetical protein ACHWQZ_G008017 [Mnemiopsis leidyi]